MAQSVRIGDRTRGLDDITAAAARAADGFRALGLREGDAVALLLGNGFAFLEASTAARLAGAYAVPLNTESGAEIVGHILRDCGAKVLVAEAGRLAGVAAVLPEEILLFVVQGDDVDDGSGHETAETVAPPGARPWRAWLAGREPIARPATAARPAVIYTSGSTGRPKGVRRAAAPDGPPSAKALAVYGFDVPGPAVALITGPLFHSVPNAYARVALSAGADLVLERRFEPRETLALVAERRISHMHLTPAMMVRLLRLPEAERAAHDTSSLVHVVHGAAHCPPAVKRAMLAWLGPVVHEYYGSTETGLLTHLGPDEALAKPGSVGRALPGVTLRIVGRDGASLQAGATGDVYAGSATLHAFDYIGDDARRAAIGRGDLVTAGDVGFLDADGFLYLRGRRSEAIDHGGREIHPAGIEARLLARDDIADAAVLGADERGPAVLNVFVEPAPGRTVDAAEVAAVAAEAAGLAPGEVTVGVRAALPREDTGKIHKARLASPAVSQTPPREII